MYFLPVLDISNETFARSFYDFLQRATSDFSSVELQQSIDYIQRFLPKQFEGDKNDTKVKGMFIEERIAIDAMRHFIIHCIWAKCDKEDVCPHVFFVKCISKRLSIPIERFGFSEEMLDAFKKLSFRCIKQRIRDLADEVLACPHIMYLGRNFSSPRWNIVVGYPESGGCTEPLPVIDFFMALKDKEVRLKDISQVFVKGPFRFYREDSKKRRRQKSARHWDELSKRALPIWASDGWSRLAQMVGKHITVANGVNEYVVAWECFPDGKVEEGEAPYPVFGLGVDN